MDLLTSITLFRMKVGQRSRFHDISRSGHRSTYQYYILQDEGGSEVKVHDILSRSGHGSTYQYYILQDEGGSEVKVHDILSRSGH